MEVYQTRLGGLTANIEASTLALGAVRKDVVKAQKEKEYVDEQFKSSSDALDEKNKQLDSATESLKSTKSALDLLIKEKKEIEVGLADRESDLVERESEIARRDKESAERSEETKKEWTIVIKEKEEVSKAKDAFLEATKHVTW
ncbi:MAG: hypothetical protein IPP74_14560 [Alphaproteobacteria bacterium]|nr:hypothetical protein [Alphaproteobacteria bacterium]